MFTAPPSGFTNDGPSHAFGETYAVPIEFTARKDLDIVLTDSSTGPFQINNIRLDQIAVLEDDWNGYGAKGFSSALIRKCRDILDILPFQPEIFPTGRQSIQLQYDPENGSYLEFEVSESKTLYLMVPPHRDYDHAETDEFTEDEKEKISERVMRFHGQYRFSR